MCEGTAGAGGTVENFSDRGFYDAAINFTTSMMVRAGGRLVENYGVTPDVSVPMCLEDLDSGGYLGRVLDGLP